MLHSIGLAICLLVAKPAFVQHEPCRPERHARLPKIAKLTYDKARAKLIASGWKPMQTKFPTDTASDPELAYGNGREFWRRGYVELEACSGTGEAPCAFLFTDKYGNRLRVITRGEEAPERKDRARVSGTAFDCT